jgi:hypothetical protein
MFADADVDKPRVTLNMATDRGATSPGTGRTSAS